MSPSLLSTLLFFVQLSTSQSTFLSALLSVPLPVCLHVSCACVCVSACLWDMLVQTCYQLFPCVQSQMDTREKNKWHWPRCKLKLSGKNYLYFLTIFHLIYSIIIKTVISKISSCYFPLYFFHFPYPYVDRSFSIHPSVCLSSCTPLWRTYNTSFRLSFFMYASLTCVQHILPSVFLHVRLSDSRTTVHLSDSRTTVRLSDSRTTVHLSDSRTTTSFCFWLSYCIVSCRVCRTDGKDFETEPGPRNVETLDAIGELPVPRIPH